MTKKNYKGNIDRHCTSFVSLRCKRFSGSQSHSDNSNTSFAIFIQEETSEAFTLYIPEFIVANTGPWWIFIRRTLCVDYMVHAGYVLWIWLVCIFMALLHSYEKFIEFITLYICFPTLFQLSRCSLLSLIYYPDMRICPFTSLHSTVIYWL